MKFSIARNALVDMVQRACGVSEPKGSMPILACLQIAAAGSSATVQGTDLYLAVQGSAPAQVSEDGSICLPAKDLLERLKYLPAGDVIVSTDDSCTATIKSAGTPRKYKIMGRPADEFPPVPSEEKVQFEVDAPVLSKLLCKAAPSISSDESKPHLAAAHLVSTGTRLQVESTDGHRLCVTSAAIVGPRFDILLSAKSVAQIRRLLSEASDTQIGVSVSGTMSFFRFKWGTFSVKLIDAVFPPVAQVIPTETTSQAQIPKAALADAAKAIGIASSERFGAIHMRLTPGTMTISAESVDASSANDEIPVVYDGPEVSVCMNASYAIDALAALDSEEISLGFSGPTDPTLWKDAPVGDTVVVIMPRRP